MRLSSATLGALPQFISHSDYDRDTRGVGIVHFGIGAFHRAHMADYTNNAMAGGAGDWRILGVSLRSAAVRDQMAVQDGLYTLVERCADGSKARVISSVADVVVASEQSERLIATLAAPTTHIASFTITEKGYCRAPNGSLDLALADDRSVYYFLAESLARRRDVGLPGLTLLSCDNLANNGAQLQQLMRVYLDTHKPDLQTWFETECACPATMVDRIVPATTDDDRVEIAAILGVRDEAAVVTEPFSQWVIENKFAGPRPAWERYGAQLTSDVHAYETAKLRMLNGAHSALAYLGLQRGHEYVHQAIGDPKLASLVDRLMRDEAATSLTPTSGQDLNAYANQLIERFKNPALNHRLIQIAMDGSQKIPQRWLETLVFHQASGRQCTAIMEALAAWIMHVRGDTHFVDDPMRDLLQELWQRWGASSIVSALFGPNAVFAHYWQGDNHELAMIRDWLH